MCFDGRYSLGSVVFTFFLGGMMGAAMTALLTPRSGRETREMISDGVNTAYESAQKAAETARERANEMLDKGQEFADKQKTIIASAVAAGKEAMEKEKERLLASFKHKEGEV
jgi:gas vesicle protein